MEFMSGCNTKLLTIAKLSHLKQTLTKFADYFFATHPTRFFRRFKCGEEFKAKPMYAVVTSSECWEYFQYMHSDTFLLKCDPFQNKH